MKFLQTIYICGFISYQARRIPFGIFVPYDVLVIFHGFRNYANSEIPLSRKDREGHIQGTSSET